MLVERAAVSACSSSELPSPYSAEVALAQQHATSDFERAVLADGVVTRAEYEEAHERWLECMREHYPVGDPRAVVRLDLTPEGLYGLAIDHPTSPEWAEGGAELTAYTERMSACQAGTVAHIAALYNAMATNPMKIDSIERFVACLKEKGLVDAAYSTANAEADLAASVTEYETYVDEVGNVREIVPDFDPTEVTGLDPNTPEVSRCMSDAITGNVGEE